MTDCFRIAFRTTIGCVAMTMATALGQAQSPVLSIEQPAGVPLVSGMGTVAASGNNSWGQCNVPKGLKGVKAIAAGWGHSVALKQDGTVVAWGINDFAMQSTVPKGLANVSAIAAGGDSTAGLYTALPDTGPRRISVWGYQEYGLLKVPADLPDLMGIAVGYNHIVTLSQVGRVRSWGDNGAGQTKVPLGLPPITAIAAGGDHTLALTPTGKVLAWGANFNGECRVPPSLRNVQAIAAGRDHSIALTSQGKVVAWGANNDRQAQVPMDLADVIAVAAGNSHSVALQRDGTVVSWSTYGAIRPFIRLGEMQSIAAGSYHNLALRTAVGFGVTPAGDNGYRELTLKNSGAAPLTIKSLAITGSDAAEFSVDYNPRRIAAPVAPATVAQAPLFIMHRPRLGGQKSATLQVTTDDPDPTRNPFVIPLTAYSEPEIAVRKSSDLNAGFTFTPLAPDRATGLIVQTVSYRNDSYDPLPAGFTLEISGVPAGVMVYSSSATARPSTVEVLYTNSIAPYEAGVLTLVYADPYRRTNWQLTLKALSLNEVVPQPGEIAGTILSARSVRPSPQGPMVEFDTARGGLYVVEYSDDDRKTWHAAVHRLGASGPHLFWVDRGQPETQTKPSGPPQRAGGRYYRAKKLGANK